MTSMYFCGKLNALYSSSSVYMWSNLPDGGAGTNLIPYLENKDPLPPSPISIKNLTNFVFNHDLKLFCSSIDSVENSNISVFDVQVSFKSVVTSKLPASDIKNPPFPPPSDACPPVALCPPPIDNMPVLNTLYLFTAKFPKINLFFEYIMSSTS